MPQPSPGPRGHLGNPAHAGRQLQLDEVGVDRELAASIIPMVLLCPTEFLTTQRSQTRSRPRHDVYGRPVKLRGDLALNFLLIGMPFSKAASVNSLKVEPA